MNRWNTLYKEKIICRTSDWHAILVLSALCIFSLIDNTYSVMASAAQSASKDVCNYVASHANKGDLEKIMESTDNIESSQIKAPEQISGEYVVFSKLLDINNDGIPERVFITEGGTAHMQDFVVYKANKDEEINLKKTWGDDYDVEQSAADKSFVKFRNVTYILGKTDKTMNYLLYINPRNEMSVVCEFGQKDVPLVSITKSENNHVCQLGLENKIKYVDFNKLHSITVKTLKQAGYWETSPSEKAALVDINNDGNNELVISINLSSGRGRGCESTSLGVLTADRTSIDKGLTEKLPSGQCGGTIVLPFIVSGKTYLDEKQSGPNAEYRQIYLLDKTELKTICTFNVIPATYVLSPTQEIEKAAGGKNPWEYAMSQPGTQVLEELIGLGRDINEKIAKSGDRPLHLAVFNKRDDLLEILLKEGANPNVKNEIMTPLHEAVWLRSKGAISLLLNYGANGNAGYGPLSEAMHTGSLDIFELLLKGGIEITDDVAVNAVQDDRDEAPDRLRLLISYGLDVTRNYSQDLVVSGIEQEAPGVVSVGPDIKTKAISQPLIEWAQQYQRGDMVEILKEKRNKQDRDRVTSEIISLLRQAMVTQGKSGHLETVRQVDAALNEVYKKNIGVLSKHRNEALRKEQIAWIKLRDKQCQSVLHKVKLDQWYRFVASDDKRAQCVIGLTRQRIEELSAKK